MDPIAAIKAASTTVKAIIILAVVLIIAGLIGWHFYVKSSAASSANRVATGQLTAGAASSKDAVDTIGNTADAETSADTMTRNNADAIDHAKGTQVAIDPAAQDAGIRALCQRPAYRGTPGCAAYH